MMSSSADRARPARVVRADQASSARPVDHDLFATPAALAALGAAFDEAAGREGFGAGRLDDARLEAARAEAHAAGFAEGRAAALAEAEAMRSAAVEAAGRALAEAAGTAATSRAVVVTEVADDAVELTYALARTILGDEAIATSLPAREVVARALALAPDGEDLVVRVPPSCELTAADLVGLCDTARISILTDAAIRPGGCVVEAGACRIDTQISSALERVRTVLARGPGPAESGDSAEGAAGAKDLGA